MSVFAPEIAPGLLLQRDGLCEVPEALQSAAVQFVTPQALFWCEVPVWPIRLPPAARWLAGDWYLKLPPRGTAAQTASRQRAMALLQLLTQDADTHELEAVFRQDPTLSYQLLRLVNSAAIGARREITSFSQAILLLGRQALKRWVNLLLFAARDDDPRSAMLLAHVCLRARGLELLAQAAGQDRLDQDEAFMAGMLSILDTLLGQPLPEVLQPLRLSDTCAKACLKARARSVPCSSSGAQSNSASPPPCRTWRRWAWRLPRPTRCWPKPASGLSSSKVTQAGMDRAPETAAPEPDRRACVRLDLAGFIAEWPASAQAFLGFEAQQAIGQHLLFLSLHSEDEDWLDLGAAGEGNSGDAAARLIVFCRTLEGQPAKACLQLQLECDPQGSPSALCARFEPLNLESKVSLRNGLIVGSEALLRWQHPRHGLLTPAHFVALAEETNLILELGEWVLNEACSQIARWRAAGLQMPPLAVNLSVRQIDRAFVTGVPLQANDCAIAQAIITMGRQLRHEIVAEGVETRAQMEYLRALGCDQLQGYLFSRPLPVAEYERLVQTGARLAL